MSNFLKNISLMTLGHVIAVTIGIISTPIYVRTIGLDGYAAIGIAMALFMILWRVDIPSFLTMIKYNIRSKGEREAAETYNSFFHLMIITNAVSIILLIPVVLLLATYAYKNTSLLPAFMVGIGIFVFERTNDFQESFFRANEDEKTIQIAHIPSIVLTFILTLGFLFFLDLGYISLLLGQLFGSFYKLIMLSYHCKKIIPYQSSFSIPLINKIFKRYTFKEYISIVMKGTLQYAGIFIATFFLNPASLGIISLASNIQKRIRQTYNIIWSHLSPLYSDMLASDMFQKAKKLSDSITILLLIGMITGTIALITIGEPLFNIYYGSELVGSFFIFLTIIMASLISSTSIPVESFLFVGNINLYNKGLGVSTILYLSAMVVLIPTMGLFGYVLAFVLTSSLHAIIFLIIRSRFFGSLKGIRSLLLLAWLIYIATLIFYHDNIIIPPMLYVSMIGGIIGLILYKRTDIIKSIRDIILA